MNKLLGLILGLMFGTTFLIVADPSVPSEVAEFFFGIDVKKNDIYNVDNLYLNDGDTNSVAIKYPAASADTNFYLPTTQAADQNQVFLSTDGDGNTAWGQIDDRHISSTISSSKINQSGASGPVINVGGTLTPVTQLTTSDGGTGQNFGSSTGVIKVDSGVMSANADLDDVNDVSVSTAEVGEALIKGESGLWIPGASGDSSFKIRFNDANTLTIKGGDGILINSSAHHATYDGAGTATSDFFEDITTKEFTGKSANTRYFVYIDTQDADEVTITSGDANQLTVNAVDPNDFYIDANSPTSENVDLNRYWPIGSIETDGSGEFADQVNDRPQRNLVNWVNLKSFNTEDWTDANFTINNSTNVVGTPGNGKYRRIGANMHGRFDHEWDGANGEASINIEPPTGFTVDETKIVGERTSVGQWVFRDSSTGFYYSGSVFYSNSANVMFLALSDGSGGTFDPSDGSEPVSIASGDYLAVEFIVPIEGWTDTSDAIATSLSGQRFSITSVNDTPSAGFHTVTFSPSFPDNEYVVTVDHTFAGRTTPIDDDANQVVYDKTSSSVVLDLADYTVDDTNFVIVKTGKGAQRAELPKVKWQKKSLGSDISNTSDANIADLEFTNLTVGKTYRATVNANITITGTSGTERGFFRLEHDNVEILELQFRQDGATDVRVMNSGTSVIFTATDTSLISSFSEDGTVSLNSGTDTTYVILEENPFYTAETDEF